MLYLTLWGVFLVGLNVNGLLIALFVFAIIGVFHPIVIKCEYYFTQRIWPLFLVCGLLFIVASLFTGGTLSIVLGVTGAACLWSIKELKEQAERVKKGWFPKRGDR